MPSRIVQTAKPQIVSQQEVNKHTLHNITNFGIYYKSLNIGCTFFLILIYKNCDLCLECNSCQGKSKFSFIKGTFAIVGKRHWKYGRKPRWWSWWCRPAIGWGISWIILARMTLNFMFVDRFVNEEFLYTFCLQSGHSFDRAYPGLPKISSNIAELDFIEKSQNFVF